MHYRLRVVEGPMTNKAFDMDEHAGLTIGRSPLNDIQLLEPGVSRTHALVMPNRNGGCLLFDMQSTNGTFIEQNGIRSCQLLPGSRFRVGATTFRVETAPAVSPGEANGSTEEIAQREPVSEPA